MSINLVQAVNAAISEPIAEQLSRQFGIPDQIVRQVATRIAPGLVASLMDRATLVPGSQSVYSVIMQHESNAHIADQLSKLIATTGGLKQLETNGHSLAALATGQRVDALTDAVASETGVPTQATSALAGIVAAVLFGIMKRHFLLAQWGLPHVPKLLRDQVGEINATMSNVVAAAIGVGNTEGFTSGITPRLDTVASSLEPRIDGDVAVAAAPVAPATSPAGKSAPSVQSAAVAKATPPAPPPMRAPVRPFAPQRSSNKWIWVLFAVLAAILALVYYRGFTQSGSVDLNAAAATQHITNMATPASSAALSTAPAIDSAPLATSANMPITAASAPESASAPKDAPASWKDAQLLFSVNPAGVPAIEATVGTEAEKKHLIDTLTARFGKAYTADVSVVPETRPATWLSRLNDFFPLMAVPGAEAKVSGSKVELSGAAADGKLGWADRLKSALGGMFQVAAFDVDGAVATATQSFRSAMKSLLATDTPCSGDKLTRVLDLQVVNFARSSAQVPESAYSTLGETAQLLKRCAAQGSMVNLDVAGYSDAQGAAPAKLEVSKERAAAVRGYLVRNGVPPQSLTATGYGDSNPIADNDTASGRFANRRIEFIVSKH
ncbi:cell envelope biogenesis protein OmpA [Caballeronia novacaledonica]|uniref:Cell envelope biogenesis protein OmpA n=1 Tax=Caballeronia novacaledonica TaxID=1544861 RepID=A0A2U3HYP5_9BURK|nr:OmpA family protein [Caballeronia novacaledonica]SPB12921.1 cell envelope biogenesis protein OmpA [Caballeronia novacaledonica]